MVSLKLFLLISAIVLFVIVFYRWLTRYLRKDDINIPFTYLFPFEREYFSGKDSIKLDLPVDALVRAELLNENGELEKLVFDENLYKGIIEKEVDVSMIKSGKYHLRLIFPDQTITRFIEVRN